MNTIPEVVIVGGGAAGASAALVLGRARADVLLIDSGQPSNAPSTGIGGLLGNDGTTPSDFYRRAARELASYPSISRLLATVTAIRPTSKLRWLLELDNGQNIQTDRILLATGMLYTLPDINGIGPRWGSSVFHCPFCHGWEHRDQPLAVLGDQAERALLLRRWTEDLTLITQGVTLADDQRQLLARAGIRIVDGEIASLRGEGRGLDTIEFIDGTTVAASGLLVSAPHQMRHPSLIGGLGLETTDTGHVATDAFGKTNVPGIWAVGDLTHPLAQVARAIGGGSNAAIAITQDLVASQHLVDAHRPPPFSEIGEDIALIMSTKPIETSKPQPET